MDLLLFTILSFFLGGSGGDLLDYVPSDWYWKMNEMVVSVETMTAELGPVTDADVAKWLLELDSTNEPIQIAAYERLLDAGPIVLQSLKTMSQDGSPVGSRRATMMLDRIAAAPRRHEIRKLMAIRKLGELQQPAAIPILQPLLKSDEPFVADYASAAIAQIERKPVLRKRAGGSEKDVWLLPATSGAVIHFNLAGGHPLDYERISKQLRTTSKRDQELATEFVTGIALDWAVKIGNVRVNAITFGLSADLGEKTGNATFIFAGQFDDRAVNDFLKRQKMAFETIGDARVFRPGPEMFAFFPTNRRLIVISSKNGNAAPAAEMVQAIKAGEGTLKTATAMADLVHSIDINAPVWGCLRVGDGYRKAKILESFDSITLSSARHGDGIALRLQTKSAATKVRTGADRIATLIGELNEQVRSSRAAIPAVDVIGDVLKDAKVTFSDSAVTVDADVKQSPPDLVMLPVMMLYGTFGLPSMHVEPMRKQ